MRSSVLAAVAALGFVSPGWAEVGDGDYCTAPGEVVSEDAAGDAHAPVATAAPDPVPGHDLLAVHWSEPAGPDQVHVTLGVDTLDPAPPNTVYLLNFKTSDGVDRFFGYNPTPVPGDPAFYYGHIEVGPASNEIVTDGPTDAASNAQADGTITWVLDRDLIAGFAAGDTVDSVVGEANAIAGALGVGFYFPVDETPGGAYTLQGNCGAKSSGSGVLGGGLPVGLLLLLTVAAVARRRR